MNSKVKLWVVLIALVLVALATAWYMESTERMDLIPGYPSSEEDSAPEDIMPTSNEMHAKFHKAHQQRYF